MSDEQPEYRVRWDESAGSWVASRVDEPNGPWLADDPLAALAGLIAHGPASALKFIEESREGAVEATVESVLAGTASYDDLTSEEDQAKVRAEWERLMTEDADGLNFEQQFLIEGRTVWVVADDEGNSVYKVVRNGVLESMTPTEFERLVAEEGPLSSTSEESPTRVTREEAELLDRATKSPTVKRKYERRPSGIAQEQARQARRDAEEAAPVADARTSQEVFDYIVEALAEVPDADVAELLGCSTSTLGRWLTEGGPTPSAEARLRTVGKVLVHLQHTLHPHGVVNWFLRARPTLDGMRPVDLLDAPAWTAELVRVAEQTRWGDGT